MAALQAPVPAAGQLRAATLPPVAPRLWIADIAPAHEPAWITRHATWLSPTERARLDRMRRPSRRAQMLAGHVLLRRLVGAASGLPAQRVSIVSDPDGRPAVATPAGWSASLAHSGRWVVALLASGDAAPGVDIEFRKPQRDIRAIVRAACGVEVDSTDHAYALWVQREAELKAGADSADVWVATWDDHALAVCTCAVPEAAAVDLDSDGPVRELTLAWLPRPRLPAAPSQSAAPGPSPRPTHPTQ